MPLFLYRAPAAKRCSAAIFLAKKFLCSVITKDSTPKVINVFLKVLTITLTTNGVLL